MTARVISIRNHVTRTLTVLIAVLVGSGGVYLALTAILDGEKVIGVIGYYWSVFYSAVSLASALESFQSTTPSPDHPKS